MRAALNRSMLRALPAGHDNPDLDRFYALIRDYPQRRGKQLRGLFVLLSTAAHGGNWQDAVEVAAALELFQNWVLIHDDIEDGSEERRGQPALHRLAGMPVALNVGDALHVYMWQMLHQLNLPRKAAIIEEFLTMIHRTAEGQHLDLSWVEQGRFDISPADYETMVKLKTAYYTVVSPLRLGAFCAGELPDERFTKAGQALGVAFQIRDDVLNLTPAEDGNYGKEFAGDLYEGKRTLILAQLFAKASPDEAAMFKAALAKPRQQITASEVKTVLASIHSYKTLEQAQRVAVTKAEEGLSLLHKALSTLPTGGSTARRKLTGLLESLALRRH